jgi:8-oxo-dGTP diphosphatase
MSGEIADRFVEELQAELAETKRQLALARKMQNTKVGVGVVVVLKRMVEKPRHQYDWEVLMGRRLGAHGADTWSFPGGWVETGETVEAAGKREVEEECGIILREEDLGGLRMPGTMGSYSPPFVITEFAAGFSSMSVFLESFESFVGEPVVREPDKCAEWRWFSRYDLPKPLFQPLEDFHMRAHLYGDGPSGPARK